MKRATPVAEAQDPAKLAPQFYHVILENDRVRVLDIHLPPGGKSPMHAHPDYLIYTLTPCRVRFTGPDGKAVALDLQAGESAWREAESHAVENLGTEEIHALNIELKS